MGLSPDERIRLIGWSAATALHLGVGLLIFHSVASGDDVARPSSVVRSAMIRVSLTPADVANSVDAPFLSSRPVYDPGHKARTRPPRPARAMGETSVVSTPTPTLQAAAPAKAAAAAASFSGLDADRFREALLARIYQFRRSPPMARQDRGEKTVWLRFVMERDGRVVSVRVDQSSGFPLLDEEAMAAVRSAAPLPAIPAGFPERLDMTLAVTVP